MVVVLAAADPRHGAMSLYGGSSLVHKEFLEGKSKIKNMTNWQRKKMETTKVLIPILKPETTRCIFAYKPTCFIKNT